MDDESGLFTSDTLLGTPVDDLFSYQTVKVVRIQDRWLGLWDVCCQITIVLIISYMLIHEYGYLEWENVSGTVNTRILGGVQNVNMSLLEYCKEMPCRLVDRYSIASYDEKSLFIDTFVEEVEQKRQCQEHDPVCPFDSAFQDMQRSVYFTAGVENMILEIRHDAQAATFYARCTCECPSQSPATRIPERIRFKTGARTRDSGAAHARWRVDS